MNQFMGALTPAVVLTLLWVLRVVEVKDILIVEGALMSIAVSSFGSGIFKTQTGDSIPTDLSVSVMVLGYVRRAYRWISAIRY